VLVVSTFLLKQTVCALAGSLAACASKDAAMIGNAAHRREWPTRPRSVEFANALELMMTPIGIPHLLPHETSNAAQSA
jgi:hypothetical protein